MATFTLTELVIALGVAIWLSFLAGKYYGREKESKAARLYHQAELEKDPDKKQQLLLEWNELCEDAQLRRVFKDALLSAKKVNH